MREFCSRLGNDLPNLRIGVSLGYGRHLWDIRAVTLTPPHVRVRVPLVLHNNLCGSWFRIVGIDGTIADISHTYFVRQALDPGPLSPNFWCQCDHEEISTVRNGILSRFLSWYNRWQHWLTCSLCLTGFSHKQILYAAIYRYLNGRNWKRGDGHILARTSDQSRTRAANLQKKENRDATRILCWSCVSNLFNYSGSTN